MKNQPHNLQFCQIYGIHSVPLILSPGLQNIKRVRESEKEKILTESPCEVQS